MAAPSIFTNMYFHSRHSDKTGYKFNLSLVIKDEDEDDIELLEERIELFCPENMVPQAIRAYSLEMLNKYVCIRVKSCK